ncbi:MAG: isochorismatase family protein [Patescibacteria group bacterium]
MLRGAKENLSNISTNSRIINCGNGKDQHPTRALLDLFTIWEEIGRLDNLKISIVGDLKNARSAHSLLIALTFFENNKIKLISPQNLKMPEKYLKLSKNFEETENFEISEEDVIYMCGLTPLEASEEIRKEYRISKEKAQKLKSSTIILNPLPRIDEIEKEFDELPNAKYFQQSKNGIFVRMAIFMEILKKATPKKPRFSYNSLLKLFEPKKTAIINIDIQKDYCSKKSPLIKLLNISESNAEKIEKENIEIIKRIERFSDIGRKKGCAVIWTRMTENNNNNNSPQKIYENFSNKKPVKIALTNTDGFDFFNIFPKNEDFEIVKEHYNALSAEGLKKFLSDKKIENLILTGFTLSGCIRATAQGANELGIHVIVCEDLIGDFEELSKKQNLKNIDNLFGYVNNSEEILKIWDYSEE